MNQPKPLISIIVAIAANKAIGLNNELLWHIPNDLKRFKRLTSGHTVIMGKRTFESLPKGALPNRRNIVLTPDAEETFTGCETAQSVEDVLTKVAHENEVFIIGGGMVYGQFLPLAHKLYLTIVHKDFEADTFFPPINFEEWNLVDTEKVDDDNDTGLTYSFETYMRKGIV